MSEISGREIVRRRLAGNGLTRPFADPLGCVLALAGIQSQFQQWAEISILNRCPKGLTMADLADLYHRHQLINLWGQRHTLHTYVREDWPLISDIYEPQLAGRNYAHNRYPEDFAYLLAGIAAECSQAGEISRARLLTLVEERLGRRPPEELYFDYTLIILSCLRGLFFGLPAKPGIKTFIAHHRIRDEVWQPDETRARAALENLMLGYFRHYGPATLADFGHWSGLPLGPAKSCLHSLKDSLTIYEHAGREYYTAAAPDAEAPKAGVLLLGKFDPLFVSYKHKDWIIPPELEKRVWRQAGWVEALVLAGDQAVGTWRHRLKGRKMSLEVCPFTAISAATRNKIQTRAEKLAKFWEKQLDSVVFI